MNDKPTLSLEDEGKAAIAAAIGMMKATANQYGVTANVVLTAKPAAPAPTQA